MLRGRGDPRRGIGLSTHLVLSLSRHFLGLWCHCRQKLGTLLAFKPTSSKTKILRDVNLWRAVADMREAKM